MLLEISKDVSRDRSIFASHNSSYDSQSEFESPFWVGSEDTIKSFDNVQTLPYFQQSNLEC